MPNEIGSFVVSIKAQIEGYQSQIEKIKKELEKVNPGSAIGKNLSRSLQEVERQIDSLAKKSTQRISSESQLVGLTDKLNDINKMIYEIGEQMTKVSWDDLTGSLGQQIHEAEAQIDSLNQSIETKTRAAIQAAVNESANLRDIFKELKINPEKMSVEQISAAFARGVQQIQDDARLAQEEVARLTQRLADYQKALEEASKVKIANFNKQEVVSSLSNVATKEKTQTKTIKQDQLNALQQDLSKWVEKLRVETPEAAEKAEAAIAKAFTDVNVDNLKDKLQALNKELKEIAGNSASLGNISSVASSEGPSRTASNLIARQSVTTETLNQEAVQHNVGVFKDLIAKYDLEQKDFDDLLTRLSNSQTIEEVNAAQDAIVKAFENYGEKASAAIKEAQQQVNNAAKNLLAGQNIASKKEALVTKGTAANDTFNAVLKEQEQKNQELTNRIEQLEQQVRTLSEQRAAQAGTAGPMNKAGADTMNQSAQNMAKVQQQVDHYSKKLDEVKAKEQTLGNFKAFIQRWFSVYAAARMVSQAFNSIKSTLKELDDVMTEISIVTDMTQENLWDQMSDYTDMARQYASSIKGVYEVSQLYYRAATRCYTILW